MNADDVEVSFTGEEMVTLSDSPNSPQRGKENTSINDTSRSSRRETTVENISPKRKSKSFGSSTDNLHVSLSDSELETRNSVPNKYSRRRTINVPEIESGHSKRISRLNKTYDGISVGPQKLNRATSFVISDINSPLNLTDNTSSKRRSKSLDHSTENLGSYSASVQTTPVSPKQRMTRLTLNKSATQDSKQTATLNKTCERTEISP